MRGGGHPRESKKKMTEGRRIEFVSNVVLGVEGMKGLCCEMLDRLSTNLEEMNKLYEEFQWSEKGSSFEEDDCVKNVLANHEALRTKFNSLEGDFAELISNLFKLSCEIDPNNQL